VLVEDDLALAVEDAQVHGPGMEIDAAVESVLAVVEAHTWSSLGMGPAPEPVSWLAGTPCLKSHVGPRHGLEPVLRWDRRWPIPWEAMLSIKRLKLTGAAEPAPAGELCRL